MDAPLMSKLECKTKAERPYSSDGETQKYMNNKCFSKIFKTSPCDKNKTEKYRAHIRKPDTKEEVLILICIIKKAIKILCRHSQNKGINSCNVPEYKQIYFFIDLTKRLDAFIENFIKIYIGRNGLCCYSKLLKELKCIRYSLSKEIEANYSLYRCKIDLVNCLMASFRSVENKICYIMAYSSENEVAVCNQGCEVSESPSKLSKVSSKTSCSKLLLKKQDSNSKVSKNKAIKDLCDCLDKEDDEQKSTTYEMTLEYCKYNASDIDSSSEDEGECIQHDLPNGYIRSKIFKKDDTISLSIKCITDDKESALLCLKKEANETKSDKLMKLAFDMAQMLDVTKKWYTSGREVCQQILKRC